MALNNPSNNFNKIYFFGKSHNTICNYLVNSKGKKIYSKTKFLFSKLSSKLSIYNKNKILICTVSRLYKNIYSIFLFIFLLFMIWICSGLYDITKSERGVVLRLGKFENLVFPGINFKIIFIDSLITLNVDYVRELVISRVILTSDENLLNVDINIKYCVADLERYLFNVTNADESIRNVTYSVLCGVISKYTIASILHDKNIIRSDIKILLEDIIHKQYYNFGINIINFNFNVCNPTEEVNNAITAN